MSETADAPRLDFVIVGAQRAGSTHLNACLQGHPDVFLCPDEVPYFEDPFFLTTPPSELQTALAGARRGQRRGIQRPDYLARPECAQRIRSFAPDARILVVLRDPVARAVSAYFWYVQFGLLPPVSLNVGMDKLLGGWHDRAYPHSPEIVEYGFYGRHLRRYLDHFGPEQVLVLLSEELRDPATFQRVYRFLGVDPSAVVRVRIGRTNPGVYDMRRLRVLRLRRRLVWSWDDTTTYSYRPRRLRRPFRFVANAAIVGFDRVVLSRVFGNGPPSLQADVEERLRATYSDDVRVLESLLGRDLVSWRRVRCVPRQPL